MSGRVIRDESRMHNFEKDDQSIIHVKKRFLRFYSCQVILVRDSI